MSLMTYKKPQNLLIFQATWTTKDLLCLQPLPRDPDPKAPNSRRSTSSFNPWTTQTTRLRYHWTNVFACPAATKTIGAQVPSNERRGQVWGPVCGSSPLLSQLRPRLRAPPIRSGWFLVNMRQMNWLIKAVLQGLTEIVTRMLFGIEL